MLSPRTFDEYQNQAHKSFRSKTHAWFPPTSSIFQQSKVGKLLNNCYRQLTVRNPFLINGRSPRDLPVAPSLPDLESNHRYGYSVRIKSHWIQQALLPSSQVSVYWIAVLLNPGVISIDFTATQEPPQTVPTTKWSLYLKFKKLTQMVGVAVLPMTCDVSVKCP